MKTTYYSHSFNNHIATTNWSRN